MDSKRDSLYKNKENLSPCLPFLLLETLFYMTPMYGTQGKVL